jgi:hypothetical protein
MTFKQCLNRYVWRNCDDQYTAHEENLTVHFKVKDFNAWRTGYDGNEKGRVSAGMTIAANKQCGRHGRGKPIVARSFVRASKQCFGESNCFWTWRHDPTGKNFVGYINMRLALEAGLGYYHGRRNFLFEAR